MGSGERPIGAAKGKQADTEALCHPPPFLFAPFPPSSPIFPCFPFFQGVFADSGISDFGFRIRVPVSLVGHATGMSFNACVWFAAPSCTRPDPCSFRNR